MHPNRHRREVERNGKSIPLRALDDFDVVAARGGYDAWETHQMRAAAEGLGLSVIDATRWLDADITPWAAAAWRQQGFADGDEAREYRRWGLSASRAYWIRHDGATARELAAHRHLFDLLSGARSCGPDPRRLFSLTP